MFIVISNQYNFSFFKFLEKNVFGHLKNEEQFALFAHDVVWPPGYTVVSSFESSTIMLALFFVVNKSVVAIFMEVVVRAITRM